MSHTLSVLFLLVGLCAGHQIRNAQNLTLYHINPANYTGIANMNTGDASGDALFTLKTHWQTWLCQNMSPHGDFYKLFCLNPEDHNSNLTVTEVIVEVDAAFGDYAECNICVNGSVPFTTDPCVDGDYVCVCNKENAVCSNNDTAVGVMYPSSIFGEMSKHNKAFTFLEALSNVTNGSWYDTLAAGECNETSPSCTWRLLETKKRVSSNCQTESVINTMTTRNSGCFNGCPQPTNTSSLCWVSCFTTTLVGVTPEGDQTGPGMTRDDILSMWLQPFRSDDPAVGGCPPV